MLFCIKTKESSPQPAFVEQNPPPLWILSPPGAIICEGRHFELVSFRHFVLVVKGEKPSM